MDENIKCSDWAERAICTIGLPIIVRLHSTSGSPRGTAEQLIKRLTEPWSDSLLPQPLRQGVESLLIDLGKVRESDFERITSKLSTQLTLLALEAHAGKLLMFHAGGVANSNGAVAIFIGPSGQGKTTTAQTLGRYYSYVSDETIAITSENIVVPYRKPLSIISPGKHHKLQIAPSTLGLLPLPEKPLTLGTVAILKRASDGSTGSKVVPYGFAAGMIGVIEQSSYLIRLDRPLSTVAQAVAQAGGFKALITGDPEKIHEVADELFAYSETPNWERVMPGDDYSPAKDTVFSIGNIVDAIDCDDGAVLLDGNGNAVLLDGIGPQLWRSACLGENWGELIKRIESLFGKPPTGNTRLEIQRIADQLVQRRILITNNHAYPTL
ncbi:hypothetical protein ACTXPA_13485 [Glutamicibacter arilaitensis]|uniref:hypothetical protein n=1 Tax=Glutamicibacter arilaitensis TaxID=256701 RepID=UPI003FD18B2B